MTDAEMRIAIAAECGWKLEDSGNGRMWHLGGICSDEAPPLYTEDLNAMHSAVMSQSPQPA